MGRRKKPTVWQALNEPVMDVSEEQARNVFIATLVIVFASWIAPYWGQTSPTVYASETIFERMASAGSVQGSQVAGAQITASGSTSQTPEWYYVVAAMPGAVADSFAAGANEVLDISGPVTQMVEFYQPGVDAVWNAWLELMADP